MTKRTWLLGPIGLLAMFALGCAGADDIDRTQPNRLPKSMFDDAWYVRSTIIGVPGTSAASFVGYTGNMEKIRWEVQESWLIAYRAYEEIPGTDVEGKTAAADAPDQYKENPIAAYPILSHFDIKREYNASTGEQTNVISENTSDRPWHERDYIRVDWSNSRVDPMAFDGATGDARYNAQYFVQEHESHPDAMRVINKDNERVYFGKLNTVANNDPSKWGDKITYFDMVGRYLLETEKVAYQFDDGSTMNIPLCYFIMYAGSNYQTSTCGAAEVKVRTSFMKVGNRNYEPVPLRDREMGKFGYFRTERFTWDRRFGFTESGRIYLANLHNIWEQAYEADGNGNLVVDEEGKYVPIPMADRTPKPIVYHLNKEFPCELVKSAQDVANSWNLSFRRAVAVAKGLMNETDGNIEAQLAKVSLDDVPNMFVLNTNGWVQIEQGDDWSCENLQRDEAKVEYLMGDLRYNTMYWVHDRQIQGPLGYGPSSPDPETGEIISGVAHVYGGALDQYANSSLDIIRMLNGDLKLENMRSGDYVKNYIAQNAPVIDPAKIPREIANLKGAGLRSALLTPKMQHKVDLIKQHGLERATVGARQRRMGRVLGTWLEEYLLDEELVRGLAPYMLQGQKVGPGDNLSKEVQRLLSPVAWNTAEGRGIDRVRIDKAAMKSIWLAEFADDSIQGLAMEVWKRYGAKKDYDAMWQLLRERIFRGVTEHEVGHTIGLRHNFAGSYDSVNFFNDWWKLRAENLKERDPMNTGQDLSFADIYAQLKRTPGQVAGKMTEKQYSTIMDYGAKFNSDFNGIGKWDHAAILFGYTGYVEIFKNVTPSAKIALRQRYSDCSSRFESTPNIAYAPVLEEWHYSSIWNLLGKEQGITQRQFKPWSEIRKSQDEARAACEQFVAAGKGTAAQFNQSQDGNRPLEVPYMMCSDEYVGASVSCHRWDEGADPYEIANNVIQAYKNYYFFNNFKRDRFGFDAYSLYARLSSRYFSYLPNVYQHWLFRVAFYDVDDANMGNIWTIGTFNGFNLLASILSAPQYGTYEMNTDGQFEIVNYETAAPQKANQIVVPQGFGRRRYSRFDYDSGYYYENQILEVGHFWEYLAALDALTASTGTFAGVEMQSDFSRYLVPYYILYEEELNKLFEGVITDNYKAYAPVVMNNGQLFTMPTAPLTIYVGEGSQRQQVKIDPATGEPLPDVNGAPALNLDNWFTLKFYTLLQGMSEFSALYSLRFADRHMVFREGNGEQVTPAPGMDVMKCHDPIGGHTYGTVYDPTIADEEQGSAFKMVKQCQYWVDRYKAGNSEAQYRMNDSIEWLNFFRGFYEIFGRNI